MNDKPSDDDTSHYEGALLEDINDKLQGIAEAVGGLSDTVEQIDHRLERVEDKVDHVDHRLQRVEHNTETLPAIKSALGSMSTDLDDHEVRLKKLERKAA